MLQRHTKGALGFFVATLALGLVLRWDLATGLVSARGLSWAHLRHAHSHAGYYGVLTLAWWLVEREAGLAIGRRVYALHVFASAAAVLGFAFTGYNVVTIALSTLVASLWLSVAAKHRRAAGGGWLDCALYGLCFSVLLIPAIAAAGRANPALSRDFAHVFIATLLLTVFVPAAWQASGLRRAISAPLYASSAFCASVCTVFAGRIPLAFQLVTLCYCCTLTWILATQPRPLKWVWLGLPAALLLSSVTSHPFVWRIAGFHLLILGPTLTSIAGARRICRIPPSWRRGYVLSLSAMTVSIVATPPLVTAMASSLFALFAAACVVRLWKESHSWQTL